MALDPAGLHRGVLDPPQGLRAGKRRQWVAVRLRSVFRPPLRRSSQYLDDGLSELKSPGRWFRPLGTVICQAVCRMLRAWGGRFRLPD